MIPTGAQPSRMRRFPTRCWISNLTRSTSSLNWCFQTSSAHEREGASDLFVRVTQLVAQAAVPRDAARALGLGRMVALQKPNGIVIGDFTRRLVARCFAQQKAEAFQEACSPFQFALSTRSGAESVVRLLTAALELDPESTLVSVDGVGAFDTMSRQAMLQGLLRVPGANQCLPFVRMFYSEPSEYVWHDADGTAHIIQQAEGGEQGDPLMPALYSLGQHAGSSTLQMSSGPTAECVSTVARHAFGTCPDACHPPSASQVRRRPPVGLVPEKRRKKKRSGCQAGVLSGPFQLARNCTKIYANSKPIVRSTKARKGVQRPNHCHRP